MGCSGGLLLNFDTGAPEIYLFLFVVCAKSNVPLVELDCGIVPKFAQS